jgi:hypothetical protein
MAFKYPSIPRSHEEASGKLNRTVAMFLEQYPDIPMQKTEKLNGRNMGFKYDGKNFTAQGRDFDLDPKGGQNFGLEWVDQLRDLSDRLSLLYKFFKSPVTLYGEQIGGGIQPISNYTEKKDFRAFDVYLEEKGLFVDPLLVQALCLEYEIPYVVDLGRVTLKEAIETVFQEKSHMFPEQVLEGYVFKAVGHQLYTDWEVPERLIFKGINPAFTELTKRKPEQKQKAEEMPGMYDHLLTEFKLRQVLNNHNFTFRSRSDMKSFAPFVKAVMDDIIKDSGEGLDKFQLFKATNNACKYFLAKNFNLNFNL